MRILFLVLLLTANEGPMRIQYECLVPIYVFPEMKLQGLVLSKAEYNGFEKTAKNGNYGLKKLPDNFEFII